VQRLVEADAAEATSDDTDSRSSASLCTANFKKNVALLVHFQTLTLYYSEKRKATDDLTSEESKPKKPALADASAAGFDSQKAAVSFGAPTVKAAPPVTFVPVSFGNPFGFGASAAGAPKANGDKELNDTIIEIRNGKTDLVRVSNKALTKVSIETMADYAKSEGSKIRHISFTSVSLDRECWVILSDALKVNKSVERLEFNECHIASSELDLIIDALAANNTISFLDLTRNRETDEKALVRILALEKTSLTYLGVSNCGLSLLHPQFASALGNNNTLTSLNLGDNKIDLSGIKGLAEGLETNKTLKKLDLTLANVGPQGCEYLAKALKLNSSLTELLMYGCRGESLGVVALMDALKSNTTLERLSIPTWYFGDVGGKSIAELLKVNKKIKYMDLRRSGLSDAIAADFAEALKGAQQMTSIDFENNGFTADGAKLIAEALQVNMTTRVNMYGNDIKPQLKNKIASSVTDNRLTLK
jgi:hypothetical protein